MGTKARLTRLEKPQKESVNRETVTLRLEVIVDDGRGNLTKNGLPYVPEPGVIVLRPGVACEC